MPSNVLKVEHMPMNMTAEKSKRGHRQQSSEQINDEFYLTGANCDTIIK